MRVINGKMRGMKINNSKGKKIDDDMMNLPKSLHRKDMSSKNGMMNMTLTQSPNERISHLTYH